MNIERTYMQLPVCARVGGAGGGGRGIQRGGGARAALERERSLLRQRLRVALQHLRRQPPDHGRQLLPGLVEERKVRDSVDCVVLQKAHDA